MIEVLEPQDTLLKQFVDSVYIFRKGTGKLEFTAYPSVNTPVALFRNTSISSDKDCILIQNSIEPNYLAIACNQLSGGTHLQYLQLVDEIAINFKPLGFVSFSQTSLRSGKLSQVETWRAFLPGLFNDVFETNDTKIQLQYIEDFLKKRYKPVPKETILFKALGLLNDTATDYKMLEIASLVGIHYKQLYRHFSENVGCSLAHYRNLVKFRTSITAKINQGTSSRLVDICYDHGYTDQPYFIKQFRKLTGENPSRFFRDVISFGNDKVIFKVD